jgi:transcriptional regulator with XRE-family HTH domain
MTNIISELIKTECGDPEKYRLAGLQIEIAELIYNLMKQNGMSQVELANRLKVQKSQVTRWLRCDANMKLDSLAKIGVALGGEFKITFEKKDWHNEH